MNIQEAKTEIIRTFRAYMKQGSDGAFRIPIQKQRPLLLIGPPGIGKTAVMEQIAREEQIGLVSYTMTHHTRQSAVGLPLIREKEYGGTIYSATEYTMSEIIASIYDCMARTGMKQGILFLDEINCVSETLSPVMLQLLQNKMFGTYAIPDGWIIAAAGNPPEYNKSVRELDMAALDRVKHMEIEADLSVWMDYAFTHDVHPCVTAYLTAHPEHFYQIQDTPRRQLFVTARGWEDLSYMMQAYEEDEIPVQESLMIQYLQHDEIARSFYLFYDLFRYFGNAMKQQLIKSDRNTSQKVMTTTTDTNTRPDGKAATTDFDRSFALWHMNLAHAHITQGLAAASHLMACVRHDALRWKEQSILEKELKEILTSWSIKAIRNIENTELAAAAASAGSMHAANTENMQTSEVPETSIPLLSQIIENRRTAYKIKTEKQLIDKEETHKELLIIRKLEDLLQELIRQKGTPAGFCEYGINADVEGTAAPESSPIAKESLQTINKAIKETMAKSETQCAQARDRLLETISRSYHLLETFPGDEPLLYFTADLTGEPDCAEPLAAGACPEYSRHARRLLLVRQEQELLQSLHTGNEMPQNGEDTSQ